MLGDKKVSYSAMQSTGTLTLGNYLGALDNWLKMQEEYECFYAIADLHSLTIRQNPAELRKRARDLYALYVAAGLDPETKNEIFELLCRIRKERNNAIVLVSHHMEDVAQFANRVWVMHEGKIAMNGTPEEVYGRVEELEEMHIGIPQITHLTYSLIQEGLPLPRPAINVADAEEMLVRIFKGEKER